MSRDRPISTSAFTLIEMLVVIAILALLTAIISPAISNALKRARTVACISNLKNLGTATFAYTADQKGELPFQFNQGGEGNGYAEPPWFNLLAPYVAAQVRSKISLEDGTDRVFKCPAQEGNFAISFGPSTAAFLDGNRRLFLSSVVSPSQKAWLLDVPTGSVYYFNPALPTTSWLAPRHNDRANVLFFDGSVQTISSEALEDERPLMFQPTRR